MKLIKILPLIILTILFGATATLSQEIPKINSAKDFRAIPVVSSGKSETIPRAIDCEADLATANQRLLKTIDALEKAEGLIKTLSLEIEARKRLEITNNEIIAAKDNVISEQKKLIEIFEKQSQRKLKILWGIISVRF